MRDDFIDPNDLLLYDAGSVDGIVVSRRFRIVSNPCEFWLDKLDSASSATVIGVACDYVATRVIAVPVELLKRLVHWANQHDDRGPTGQGWQSDELQADIRAGEELLKARGAS